MRKRLITATAAAALTVGFTASPAQAASLEYQLAVPDSHGAVSCQAYVASAGHGYGCFHASGEWFFVGDTGSADRSSVAVHWKLADGSRVGLIRNKMGAGNPGERNKSFDEGKTVSIRLGICNQTATRACDKVGDYTWLTGWDSAST